MGRLERAAPEDIPAIMTLERGEGFDRLVGRWTADAHLEAMSGRDVLHLVWRQGDDVPGFVMFDGIESPHRAVRLRRIAVREPGRGLGSTILEEALAHAFEALEAHRLHLMVFIENTRAERAYRRAGFVDEGVLRDCHRTPEGEFRSMRMMSILQAEWRSARPR
jgi:RimJ/RimL family protein N-acetyltransferase